MSHDYHEGDPETILYDGCAECEKRATRPLDALCNMDATNLPLLWNRMLNVRMASVGRPGFPDAGGYRSHLERTVGEALYLMGVLDERGALRGQAWSPYRFGALT